MKQKDSKKKATVVVLIYIYVPSLINNSLKHFMTFLYICDDNND